MARGARPRRRCRAARFATSRKIPEEVFRTGEPRIVADLLDGDLANVHMGTVALGIRNVAVRAAAARALSRSAEAVGRGAAHRRALSRQPREGHRCSRTRRAPRSRRWRPKPRWRSRTPGSTARRWRRRGWSRRCGSPPRSSRRCCRRPGASGAYFRAAAASLPCRSIGGDFYDYVDLPDGSFGFALGDVAGKGPPAALLSAMMQGMFAAQAAGSDSPSRTIAHVNLALYRRGIESRFVTLMYGVAAGRRPADVLQRRSQSAARHRQERLPAARVRRADRRPVRERAATRRRRSRSTPGDWLIVFSDGVSEALSATGEEYGESRILAVVQSNLGARAAEAARGASSPTCASSPRARRRATTSRRWCCAIGS